MTFAESQASWSAVFVINRTVREEAAELVSVARLAIDESQLTCTQVRANREFRAMKRATFSSRGTRADGPAD